MLRLPLVLACSGFPYIINRVKCAEVVPLRTESYTAADKRDILNSSV